MVSFIAIQAAIVGLAAFMIPLSIHKIEEGFVGVYWRGGALLKGVTEPGFHLKIPFVTSHEQLQTTIQTDAVREIPCGTSGGVMISFSRVEVVNRLKKDLVYDTVKNYSISYDKTWIYDKIHHEINQFCSSHTLQEVYIDQFDTVDERLKAALQRDCDTYAPGIEIIAIRVTKPSIPPSVQKDYERMESEKMKFSIELQTQKVVQKEAETERLRATIEAEKNREVSQIKMEQSIMEREAQQKMSRIDDETKLARDKAQVDAAFYRQTKEMEANKLLLTREYLQLELIRAVANNTKMYFGTPDIGNVMKTLMGDTFFPSAETNAVAPKQKGPQ